MPTVPRPPGMWTSQRGADAFQVRRCPSAILCTCGRAWMFLRPPCTMPGTPSYHAVRLRHSVFCGDARIGEIKAGKWWDVSRRAGSEQAAHEAGSLCGRFQPCVLTCKRQSAATAACTRC